MQTDWPVGIGSTSELAIRLKLLGFSRGTGKSLEVWADAIASAQDDVSAENRVRLRIRPTRAPTMRCVSARLDP
jgi:hypothetical protein